jgi:hypothetical protein
MREKREKERERKEKEHASQVTHLIVGGTTGQNLVNVP